MSETWLILGASSAMARAMARQLDERGDAVLLEVAIARLKAGGQGDHLCVAFDALDPSNWDKIVARMDASEGTLNVAAFVGSMPPQDDIDADPALIDGVVQDSFAGPARLIQMIAPLLEERGSGTIVGVGSVAGDRGRVGNYVYGGAKAGFHAYLSGLRNRLGRKGVHVITVKPGFVDTAMTWGIEGMFLVASPDAVAQSILRAVRKKRDVIYTPFFWRYIMLIIRMIPERIFKKMSI